jgi:DNA-binding NarL/FixJ family response regulator
MPDLRILLVDDHAIVREGLRAILDGEPGLKVVGEAANGREALASAVELNPDLAIVDVSMPEMNGAQVTARLHEQFADCKVVALTVHRDRGYLRQLLDAGASGYVLKQSPAADILEAIRVVAAGGTFIDPAFGGWANGLQANRIDGAGFNLPSTGLSEREEEVLAFIAQGYSNKEIAARLRLSVKTVETYKARSLEKLGLFSRVDIVRYGTQRGWLTPS